MTATTVAAVFHGPDRPIELRAFARPVPRGSEVLVGVTACTLCGSDLHTIEGRRNVATPTVLGHEVLGVVAAFGPDAPRRDFNGQPLQTGDRVTWAVVASCGGCFYCGRDLPQKCERGTKYGHEAFRPDREPTGGLASHCLLAPGTALFRVPDGLPDEVACPANCATATVAAALEAAGRVEGARVLITGCGLLGVTAAAWCRARGALEVVACDAQAERSRLALDFGATCAVTPEELEGTIADRTGRYGVDVALELSGSSRAVEGLLPRVRVGGVVVLVGAVFPTPAVNVFPEQVVRRCLTVRGVHNYAPRHLASALSFLDAARERPFASLVPVWHPLSVLSRGVPPSSSAAALRVGVRPD